MAKLLKSHNSPVTVQKTSYFLRFVSITSHRLLAETSLIETAAAAEKDGVDPIAMLRAGQKAKDFAHLHKFFKQMERELRQRKAKKV